MLLIWAEASKEPFEHWDSWRDLGYVLCPGLFVTIYHSAHLTFVSAENKNIIKLSESMASLVTDRGTRKPQSLVPKPEFRV